MANLRNCILMTEQSLSVIIPTFNSAHLVTQAVESVLAQTLPAQEIVVIDDGSQDDTQIRMRRYAGRVRYIRQSNQGVSAARNHGVRVSSGSVIGFLDADDVWHPEKAAIQVLVLKAHPEIGLLGTRSFEWPCPEFPHVQSNSDKDVTRLPLWRLLVQNCFATSSVFVRRAAFDAAGGFDLNLRGPEDRDLWWRIAEICEVARLESTLMGYRMVEGSLSAQPLTMEAGGLLRLRKADDRGVWKGDRRLRREAFSCHYFGCRNGYDAANLHGRALICALKSLAWHPLPYRHSMHEEIFLRYKALAVSLLRYLGLKGPKLSDSAASTSNAQNALAKPSSPAISRDAAAVA